MNMIESKSSQVAAYGHDAERRVLRVRFRSGSTYEYEDFSAEKFAEMQAADSHGKFLASRVKPYHEAMKLPPETAPAAQIPLANKQQTG